MKYIALMYKKSILSCLFLLAFLFQIKAMGQSGSKDNAHYLKKSNSHDQVPKSYDTKQSVSSGDLFKEIKGHINAIERSRSKTDMRMYQELQKSRSRSKFLEEVKTKRREQSLSLDEKEAEEQAKAKAKAEEDEKKEFERQEKERQMKEEEEKMKESKRKRQNPFEDAPKKMDDIFGPLRDTEETPIISPSVFIDPSFDPNKKEITGMSETVQLKKTSKGREEPKKEHVESKLSQREKLFANMGKPAKFQKLKKPKEPTPPSDPPPKEPTSSPPKESTPSPPKEPTPPKEKTPEPPPSEVVPEEESNLPSPTRILPPKIGINGFNGVGRLVLRAAIEAGLDVKAVNDPFVPIKYMVYMLKFDLAMSTGGVDSQSKKSKTSNIRKEIYSVRESTTGDLVINGNVVHVFTEHDISRIPWAIAGVNYVVEATEVLNSKEDAMLHLTNDNRGVRMKHILAAEDIRNRMTSASPEPPMSQMGLVYGGCKTVIIAGPSDNVPLHCVGVTDTLTNAESIRSHVSAPVGALVPVLHLLNKYFKVKTCGYTLIRSIRGGEKKDIKCANLGPTTHARSVKWDFSENLVPTTCPSLDAEAKRILPFLHGKLSGIAVYVPTPDVSLLDLTLQFETQKEDLYQDVCMKIKEASEDSSLRKIISYRMLMSAENSASSLFIGQPHSCVVDAKSGCQLTKDTIKLILWFDNEYGFANRIIDLIQDTHKSYCDSQEGS